MDEKQEQLVAQCKAIAHMATAIAKVHKQLADLYARGYVDERLVDVVGRFTASRMEALGDMLNNMDAVIEEDNWTDQIFERAHKLWPVKGVMSGVYDQLSSDIRDTLAAFHPNHDEIPLSIDITVTSIMRLIEINLSGDGPDRTKIAQMGKDNPASD